MKPYILTVTRSTKQFYSLNETGCQILGASCVPTDRCEIDAIIFRNEIWKWCEYPKWHQHAVLPITNNKHPVTPYAYWHVGKQLYIVDVDTGHHLSSLLYRMQRYLSIVRRARGQETPTPHVYFVVKDLMRGRWMKEILGEETPWLQLVHLK